MDVTPVTHASLPVQQRAWETRERILAAAVSCLAEEGYAATTTSAIQARAEVSRGSILHQFPSRDDLLIAAVQHLAVQRTDEIDVRDTKGPETIDEAIDEIWLTYQGPLFLASVQLWAAAQHNRELADALRPREHELGHHIREVITRAFGSNAAHPAFADLVPILLSSMRGVAITYLFEPREHAHESHLAAWKRLAHAILDSGTGSNF
ncbi:TetR/AcrR family transcriptional regulator [Streptosporangium sp. NPDC006013]|uniref:TetR/AcrR family transcriptional regulator n=1 Tax=Streptosporangium sp. NPDC006013 TaxID=3155596 RepID=UPI0033BE6B2B